MKTIAVIFSIFFVLVAVILFNLTNKGVSLRAAPIISPSLQSTDYKNVAHSVVLRLFPDFQTATHVVIGYPPESLSASQILTHMTDEYEKTFNKKVSTLLDNGKLTQEDFIKCMAPCWILTAQDQANELTQTPPVPKILNQIEGSIHFHLTIIPFQKIEKAPEKCLVEKRLTLDCLIPITIYESRKKMKNPEARYFFMRKYNDKDYFLFTQSAS